MLALCLAALADPRNAESFTAFFNRYHRYILYIAQKHLRTYHAAEDVAQEVLIYIAEHYDDFRLKSHPQIKRYLLLCTQSKAVDYLRKNEKFDCAPLDDSEPEAAPMDTTEQIVLRAETARRAMACVAALPVRYRAPLQLYLDDVPYDEIAEILEISKEAAYKRVQRAYALLRQEMEENDAL